jgi:2-aminoadipate transaminase
VLEDNPYGLLRYEGDPLPTLYSLDGGEYVIYLGTFSKILSPGLRLGWAAAPRRCSRR